MTARILIWNNTRVLGGAEMSLVDLLSSATSSDEGFRFVLACPPHAAVAKSLQPLNIPVVPVAGFGFRRTRNPAALAGLFARSLRTNLQLARILARHRIDLVHCNNTAACLQAFPAARMLRVPLVWHVRDAVKPPVLTAWLRRGSAAIVTISDWVGRRLFGEHAHTCTTVYNGIRLRHGVQPTPGAAADVVMVAQFARWKRHDIAIQVALRLRDEFPRLRMMLLGATHDRTARALRDELVATVRAAGLEDNVIFAGHRADAHSLLEGSKVLIHPAENEPMGRVVAESMLLRTPVVAARSGAVQEIVRDGIDGLLVEPGNVEGFAEAVGAVLRGQAATQMVDGAQERARMLFDPRRQSRAILDIYERVLGARPPGVPAGH